MRRELKDVPPGKTWGYARGSTDEQEETLIAQAQAIITHFNTRLATRGYTWGGNYIDRGVSGGVPLLERPAGYHLSLGLSPGDVIVITALDRAFRSVRDLVNSVDGWDDRGIRFVILNLDIDTGTPVGRAAMHMMAVFGQFEREVTGERVKATNKSRKERGLPIGGRYPPYGFKTVGAEGQRRFIPNPVQRALGSRIVDWFNGGYMIDQMWAVLLGEEVNNPNTGEPIGRASIWRYYVGELRVRAIEKMVRDEGERGG